MAQSFFYLCSMIRWKIITIIVLQLAVAFSPTVYFHACCCGSEQSWFLPPDDCCEDDHHQGIGNCCDEASIHLEVDDWTNTSAASVVSHFVFPVAFDCSVNNQFSDWATFFVSHPSHAPPFLEGKRYLMNLSLLLYDDHCA